MALARTSRPQWWPPAEDQEIGLERAQELVGYLREKAPPVIAIAKQHLRDKLGEHVVIDVRASSVKELATLRLDRAMGMIPIGTVSTGTGGMATIVSIGLTRSGRVSAQLSKASDEVQRWVAM